MKSVSFAAIPDCGENKSNINRVIYNSIDTFPNVSTRFTQNNNKPDTRPKYLNILKHCAHFLRLFASRRNPLTSIIHFPIKCTRLHYQGAPNCTPIELRNRSRTCLCLFTPSSHSATRVQFQTSYSESIPAPVSPSLVRHKRRLLMISVELPGGSFSRAGLFLFAVKGKGRLRGSHVIRC